MARVQFGAVAADARGGLADLVYSRNRYGAYVRSKGVFTGPLSIPQQSYNALLAGVSRRWGELSERQRASWESFAKEVTWSNVFGLAKRWSGQGLFMHLNLGLAANGFGQMPEPPSDLNVSAVPGFDVYGTSFVTDGGRVIFFDEFVEATFTPLPDHVPNIGTVWEHFFGDGVMNVDLDECLADPGSGLQVWGMRTDDTPYGFGWGNVRLAAFSAGAAVGGFCSQMSDVDPGWMGYVYRDDSVWSLRLECPVLGIFEEAALSSDVNDTPVFVSLGVSGEQAQVTCDDPTLGVVSVVAAGTLRRPLAWGLVGDTGDGTDVFWDNFIVNPVVVGDFVLYGLGGVLQEGEVFEVWATKALSPGVHFVKPYWRRVGVFTPADDGSIDISAQVRAIVGRGRVVPGARVAVKVNVINSFNGARSPGVRRDTFLVAAPM